LQTGGENVTLAEGILAGDQRALARLITMVENRPQEAISDLQALYPHTGKALVVGITGPPGAGKSTLVGRLAKKLRQLGKTVGIIAVDPTSPFTGGAILGDRIRMQELATDPGVFIRSMGTRGSLGGLAKATHNVIRILDAAGKDYIFVETVGVGQSEVDIVKTADTTLVVLVPGLGDDIQTIKAGILEIADIFVVNKADRQGADRVVAELEMMLDLSNREAAWRPPVYSTIATTNKGIDAVVEGIEGHIQHLRQNGQLEVRRRERYRTEIMAIVEEEIKARLLDLWSAGGLEQLLEKVAAREKDPFAAAREILQPITGNGKGGTP
jgi:LAO/AO transport system kinase